jgi:uncharacterized protein (DUF2147 family)
MISTIDKDRRSDIDTLRVLATLLLFVFHTGMIFNPAPFFHVRNDELSIAFLVFCGFISLWHMPLFFLLAGWSLARSLDTRGPRGLLAERLLRIGVPLVACTAVFGPPIKFIELSSGLDFNHRGLWLRSDLLPSFREVLPSALPTMPTFDQRFVEFLPQFFTNLDRFSWSHLWFLAYLLTFTFAYLPILSRLTPAMIARLEPRAWLVFAPIIPLAAVQLVLRPHWPGIQNLYDDWANFAYYSLYLVIGFVLAVTSPGVILACTAIAGWSFIVAILGTARRKARSSTSLTYLSEAALPIYILHQPAIVFIGYVVVGWSLGIFAKFTLIVLGALAMSFAVYHWSVRRFALLRLLTGMPRAGGAKPSIRSWAPACAALAAIAAAEIAGAESKTTPEGLWWAEGGAAQVRITPCDTGLCGEIEWLRSPFGPHGCAMRDDRNPDPGLRSRPVAGLRILEGLERRDDHPSEWIGGTVYDPGSGNSYRCTLRLAEPNRIELRGYIGIPVIGRTTNWFRVGSEAARCDNPGSSG